MPMESYADDTHALSRAEPAAVPDPVGTGKHRRRPPHPEEQKRREEWAKEWRQVGIEHAKKRGWRS